jgi:hypothetical protein
MKLTKIIVSSLIVALALALSPREASAEWKQDSNGWWNAEGSSWSIGWKQIDGEWYYFDNNGYMKTGWIENGSKWYYLYSSGAMANNTIIDGYSLDSDGVWSQSMQNTSSSSGTGKKATTSNTELNLNWNEVQKINISVSPPFFKEVNVSDEKQIQKIIDYFNSLNTIKTKEDPRDYYGGGYYVEVYLKNGNIRGLELIGNKFFGEQNRFTYEIPYEEATKFDTIFGNILEGNEDETIKSSILGKVFSVNAETRSCVIKDEYNKTYDINLRRAEIIDVTGNGCLILHQGDVVKVYYQKEFDNDDINALTVYIK